MDRQADLHRVLTQIPVVDARVRAANQLAHIAKMECGQLKPIGTLGAHRRHLAGAEQATKLVLCRHHQDARTCRLKRGVDGRSPQKARIAELDFLAGGWVQVVIAGHAVQARRHPRHDRQVVGIGERRHVAQSALPGAATRQQAGEPRHQPTRQRVFEVHGIAAVDGEHDGRPARQAVLPAVDLD